jgi:hypothetical protein
MPRPVGVLVESHGVVVHHGLEVFRIREVYLVKLGEVIGSCVAVDYVRPEGVDELFHFADRLYRRPFGTRNSFSLLTLKTKYHLRNRYSTSSPFSSFLVWVAA